MKSPRHFLTFFDFSAAELEKIIQRAMQLKKQRQQQIPHEFLKNRLLAMIFEKSSTRTRVAFEAAMVQCGGSAMFLTVNDTQWGRGEPIEDMARVLSSIVDCVMIRTYAHTNLERFAKYSRVPVINGLSDLYHPCQLLADIQTYYEKRGALRGKTVAWIGDGNNMCHSYIQAAQRFDFQLRVASPPEYAPKSAIVARSSEWVKVTDDPTIAVKGADLVVTDVWASMGWESEQEDRAIAFSPYQVDVELMALAKPDALFMHCLPAHRGEEVTAEVIDGPHSVVWEEAENRLHSQKALLEFLLVGDR